MDLLKSKGATSYQKRLRLRSTSDPRPVWAVCITHSEDEPQQSLKLMLPGPKERHLETILHSTLRHIILTHAHPRTLIQITLQILSTPPQASLLRPSSYLPPLPALLQASVLGLLDACIPLSATLNATSVAVLDEAAERRVLVPDVKQILAARSVHVFAFSSKGQLLVAESEGVFDVEAWERAVEDARGVCCSAAGEGGQGMDVDGGEMNLQDATLRTVEGAVQKARSWKGAG